MWRPLTREDILTKLSGDELASIEAQLEASGVELSALIGQAINRVRGFISAHPANTLGPEGTLPERIIADVVAWLIPELYGHTAGLLIDLNETRVKASERAERLFRDVAAGHYYVEDPQSTGADNKATVAPSMTRKKLYFTRPQQDGI